MVFVAFIFKQLIYKMNNKIKLVVNLYLKKNISTIRIIFIGIIFKLLWNTIYAVLKTIVLIKVLITN